MSAVHPFGEAAFLVEAADAARAQGLRRAILAADVVGINGLVPGRASLLVEFDPSLVSAADVRALLAEVAPLELDATQRVRDVPVAYGGAHGPDLAEVARLTGLTPAQVVARHAAAEHRVLFDGFAPGFAYLAGLPEEWEVPRLATPRTRVPAGSVAIADGMSGIYPAALPGGWRIIGATPIGLFDPRRERPAYLEPGDLVRFHPLGPAEWDRHAGSPDDW